MPPLELGVPDESEIFGNTRYAVKLVAMEIKQSIKLAGNQAHPASVGKQINRYYPTFIFDGCSCERLNFTAKGDLPEV